MTDFGGSRVLLLGATGTLGSAIAPILSERHVVVTTASLSDGSGVAIDSSFDALASPNLEGWLGAAKVSAVVNCIAALARPNREVDTVTSVGINAWFPHRLAAAAAQTGLRVVQISTDGVFSGRRGGYSESDVPDPIDRYGREKLVGELDGPGCLTLRTTFFGSTSTGRGLVEWLLARSAAGDARIDGYARYVFSGLSTRALGEAILDTLALPSTVHGVFHVGGPAVSKHELLTQLVGALELDLLVDPLDDPQVDR